MALFSATDIAEFRDLQDDLAFADDYRLERRVVTGLDSRGNPLRDWQVIESGTCRLRALNRQEAEQVYADRLGWMNGYAIDLPWDTDATPEDRIVINDRTFTLGPINREAGLGMNPTALADERSH